MFADPFQSVVITPLANGELELLDRAPAEAENGFDTMRDKWLVRNDASGDDINHLLNSLGEEFARGTKIEGMNMWITSRSAKVLAWGLFEMSITSMGLLSPRGYKVTYDAAAASQSAKNTLIGDTVYAKVAAREGGVTANFEYVVIDSVEPENENFLTALTGRPASPPTGWVPTIPDSIWDFLNVFTYNYPNGWIFEGANMVNIPGVSTVYLVREKYLYQRDKTPG